MKWTQGRVVVLAGLLLGASAGVTRLTRSQGDGAIPAVSPERSAPDRTPVRRSGTVLEALPVDRTASAGPTAEQPESIEDESQEAVRHVLTVVVKGANRLGGGKQGTIHLHRNGTGGEVFYQTAALVNGEAAFSGVPPGTLQIRLESSGLQNDLEITVEWDPASGSGSSIEVDLNEQERKAMERTAVATLRSLAAAQQQMQASAAMDSDGDGGGEYGYMTELSGHTPLRVFQNGGPMAGGPADRLNPPFLASAFGKLEKGNGFGAVLRKGYYYRIHLPGPAPEGAPVPGLFEAPGGGSDNVAPDPSHAEILWGAYAWPADLGPDGLGTFFINQEGDVIEVEKGGQQSYVGLLNGPAFDAAHSNETPGDMRGQLAIGSMGKVGNDGLRWLTVGN